MEPNPSCFFCQKYMNPEKISGGVIFESDSFFVMHQQPPVYILGWTMLVPKKHVTDQMQFSAGQAQELVALQMKYTKKLLELTGAERIYWVMFGEKVKHLHFHLIPIRKDLAVEAKGPNIFSWVGEKALPDEEIAAFCRLL